MLQILTKGCWSLKALKMHNCRIVFICVSDLLTYGVPCFLFWWYRVTYNLQYVCICSRILSSYDCFILLMFHLSGSETVMCTNAKKDWMMRDALFDNLSIGKVHADHKTLSKQMCALEHFCHFFIRLSGSVSSLPPHISTIMYIFWSIFWGNSGIHMRRPCSKLQNQVYNVSCFLVQIQQ